MTNENLNNRETIPCDLCGREVEVQDSNNNNNSVVFCSFCSDGFAT